MPVSNILTKREIVDHYYVKTDKDQFFKNVYAVLNGSKKKLKLGTNIYFLTSNRNIRILKRQLNCRLVNHIGLLFLYQLKIQRYTYGWSGL